MWNQLRSRLAPYATGAILVMGFLSACGDDGTSVPSTLVVSPLSLHLSVEAPEATFSLAASPSGGHLEWRVTASPSWVTVTPSSGTITGNIVTVTVTGVSLSSLPAGTNQGTIEVISDGGSGSVGLVAQIPVVIAGSVSPPSLEFAAGVETIELTIRSTGNRALTWSAQGSGGAVTLSPSGGSIPAGDSVEVEATANRDGLPVGSTDLTLSIQTNAPTGNMTVPVRIDVPPEPRLTVTPSRLRFPLGGNSASFIVNNPGSGDLTWSTTPPGAWLTVNPSSGTILPGASQSVTATVNRSLLPSPDLEATLTIDSNATGAPTVLAVSVSSVPGWPKGLTVLDHRVVDAEYSRSADLLLTVSASPAQLHISDPLLGTTRSVDLSLPPTAVSVSPSGSHAAVGHDGYVTLVNVSTATEERVYPVTAEVLDLVLAANGWVYVFPRRDQWEQVRCIELATGAETLSTGLGIYAGTVARLHPSGDYMYGANRGLSPSDFEKFDLRPGTAHRMYDSPYHGDFSFGGDVWISDDGGRLFARSGNVFRSSPIQEEDMLYNGKLSGVSFAKWVEHSSAANRVFAFDTPSWGGVPALEILVYDPAFLNALGGVQLPYFPAPPGGASYRAHGQFIFVDSSGQRVYAVVQADPASGYNLDWGVVVLGLEDLP